MKEICRHNLERAYLFLDGEVLSEAERAEVSVHLEECAPCLERYGLEEEVLSLVTRLRSSNPPCPGSLKERISSLLELP